MNTRLTHELTRRLPTLRRRRKQRRARIAATTAGGVAVGAGLGYLLDPVSGRRRRRVSRDRLAGSARRLQKALHRAEVAKDHDDVTLARKVETEIFRDPDVPKGRILVNVQHGVVQLRGEVPSADTLDALVKRTRDVHGVERVESLLHLPGTGASMHQ